MRKLSYILAVLFLAAANLAAGQTTTTAPRPNIVVRLTRASLHGITLTDAEQTGIKSVADAHRPKFQALAAVAKTERLALRNARQSHDTAAAVAARKTLRATRTQIATELRAYLSDVRTKLSAEDQATFDGNIARVRRLIQRWRNG